MPSAPLDTLETVVNISRVRLNDAIQAASGDVLTDAAAFTIGTINGAWRRLQEMLVNFGFPWLTVEIILDSVPLVVGSDPGIQVYINWANYFNGTALVAAPVLPQDLIAPVRLWERAHAGAGSFYPMDRLMDGLPAVPKIALNRSWEWRNGAIRMPGATVITDLRVRYAAFYADFVISSTTAFTAQNVPIVRSLDAFAWFICSEVAKPRGDLDAGSFDVKAQQAVRRMIELDPAEQRAVNAEVQPPEKG